MGEREEIPPASEQKLILETVLSKSMSKGEKWYLVDAKWMKTLEQFLGMEGWKTTSVAHPGPIDNSMLMDQTQKEVMKDMLEHDHYELVPEEGWQKLVSWYGLTKGQEPIIRNVVQVGKYPSNTIVEIYLLEIKCIKDFDYNKECILKVSQSDLISEIDKKLRLEFNIDQSSNTRLWNVIQKEKFDPLNMDKTVSEVGLNECHWVVIEVQRPNGVWCKDELKAASKGSFNTAYSSPSPGSVLKVRSGSPLSTRSRQMSALMAGSNTAKQPGLCGLINLGNTCFMNSMLQCMSNCPPITEYFLAGHHLKELNETNPLGMKGEIAKAYGELIKVMWAGDTPYTVPHFFKIQVGKFNPSFCGCQQHDSQELLTFLLDGLHEDLNRIIKKPYIPIKDDDCQRKDEIVAQETWDNYRKRNDSVIVDTFHGLLKSRVVCPECERLSVTFDPFCYLSLPLPLKKERIIMVRYIPADGNEKENVFKVTVPKKGSIRDLCMEIHSRTGNNPDFMLVAEINNCHFHRFFCNDDSLDLIEDKDIIYIFQLNVIPNPLDPKYMVFPVCFWEVHQPDDVFVPQYIFGVPFIIVLERQPISTQHLHKVIIDKMQRHFSFNDSRNNIYNGDFNLDVVKDFESNYQDAFFKLYIIDTYIYMNPEKLEPEDGFYNLQAIHGKDSEKPLFGRQTILLQFTAEQRREYYTEKSPKERISNVNPRERSKITIQTCLSLFTTCEKLSADDAWYCPTCSKHQRATKKFDLWKLPKILIIHLKRFSYTRYRRDKIDTLVEFPIHDLRMSDYVINSKHSELLYDLVGVCNHYGNMGGGHYTAYCKNKFTQKWYCFDDNVVSPIAQDNIMTSAAYVLFYMAKESRDHVGDESMDIN